MSNQNTSNEARPAATYQPRQSNPLMSCVKALASLKLTVALLAFALFGVLTATLQLAWADIWTVKKMHFPNPMEFQSLSDWGKFFVYIPFQTYFIPAWFPKTQDIPYGFYMPSGVLVIALMMINLTAAHLFRFRLQASGSRLLCGIAATLLGAVAVYAIVMLGQNRFGIQGESMISNSTLWKIVIGGSGFLAALCSAPIFTLDKSRWLEKIGAGLGSAFFLFVAILMLWTGKDYLIGQEGARILWLMMQGAFASLILLAGCVLMFKRKGAIVLIHGGLMLLMVGELYTTYSAVESQTQLIEGESRDYSSDIRFVELAVVDITEDTHWDETIIPGWMLNEERSSSTITHKDLPFDIVVGNFYRNSVLKFDEKQSSANQPPRPSDFLKIVELAPVTGATNDGVDSGSVELLLVEPLKNKSKDKPKILAEIIASQAEMPKQFRSSVLQEKVKYNERDYIIYLRFRRVYKPYEMRLIDTNRTLYVGTQRPRSFSSEFEIIDHRTDTTSVHKISMNNPLRYGNETFYQQGYQQSGGMESSTIQIVHNSGWMIPYVCCMIVGIGLVAHFVMALFAFLKRAATRRSPFEQPESADAGAGKKSASDSASGQSDKTTGKKSKKKKLGKNVTYKPLAISRPHSTAPRSLLYILPIVAGALAVLFAAYNMMPPSRAADNEMDLNQFGHMPVTCNGRTMPLDSLARNLARNYSDYETLRYGTDDEKRPAIQWLADVMFETPGFDQYKLFRIDEPSLRYAMGLERRKGFRYTAAEIESNLDEFTELARAAEGKERNDRTNAEKHALTLMVKWREYLAIKRALNQPVAVVDAETGFERIGDAVLELSSGTELPLLLQTDQRVGEDWIARSKWANVKWFARICEENNINSVDQDRMIDQVANILTTDYFAKYLKQSQLNSIPQEQIDETVNQLLQEELKKRPEIRQAQPDMTEAEIERLVKNMVENPPPQIADSIKELRRKKEETVRQFMENQVSLSVSQRVTEISNTIKQMVALTVGLKNEVNAQLADNPYEKMLREIEEAYLDGDVKGFNSAVETYITKAEGEDRYNTSTVNTEWYYNSTAPWFAALVLYLVSFVVFALSWAVSPRVVGRMGLGIILVALVLHLVAIVLRVYISGRAPVTNLYSSAVFIGFVSVAAFLVLEFFVRMGVSFSLASISGFGSLMIAYGLSLSGDTFTVMQAVLDTNFWLSTHVVCISIGYSATLIAGLLGCAYVVASVLTPAFCQTKVRKTTVNVIYGVTCYAMIFSFVGTVLGGLWADDSWGRFWGWDPKENGALMIVLANALLLHARWGGLVKDRGIAILAIVGNIVTVWSWFAVNEMGVGLHQYGFTEGTMYKLSIFWLSQIAIIGIACIPYKYWVSRTSDGDTSD